MAEHQRINREKTEGLEESSHKKKAQQQLYDQLKAPDEGIVGFSAEPSVERHAALVANAHSDTQRATIVTQLQQSYGNAYVQRLLNSRTVRARLTVSQPDDDSEREADRVANIIMQTSAYPIQRQEEEEEEELQMKAASQVQRQEEEEEEEEMLQPKPAGSQPVMVSKNLETQINAARGGGQPLDDSVRASLEPQFGHDFGEVKVHTDAEANRLSQQLGAEAFTTGRDIFFREGAYQPGSSSGKGLIAHELTHVVQQQAAPALQRQEEEEELQMRRAQTLEPWGDQYVIQKAIDRGLVEEYKELHQIEGDVKVVEVPNDRAITLATTFGTYPADNIYGLEGGDINKSVFSTNWTPEQQADIRRDDPGFLNEKAYDIMDMLGGGGYNHIHDMVILREGFQPRDLKHEMGHMKQAEKGFTGGNTQIIILEYHNILKHENVALEEGEEIRTFYNESNTRPVSNKTWEELKEAVGEDGPTTNALRQIEAMLNMPRYRGKKAEIKQNLISEYFNAIR